MQEPTFLILTALAAGMQHGYGIITDVSRISEGRVRLRAGTLYAALDRLRADDLIEVDHEEIVDGRLRRYYQLSEQGGRQLAAEAARLQANAAAALSRLTSGAGAGMTGQAGLARRYRQRLALYPRAYRRDHEDEMLAVLLEGAPPGQEFPRVAESADLIWGALRMRMSLARPYDGNAGSDALAAFSVLAPLLLAGPAVVTLALHLAHAGPPPAHRFLQAFRYYEARTALASGLNLAVAGQLAVAFAIVLRLRRLALAVIAVVLALWLFRPGLGIQPGNIFSDFLLTCYLLEAVALIVSPGPRRGLQLLTWRSGAVVAGAAAVLTVAWALTMRLAFGAGYISGVDARDNVRGRCLPHRARGRRRAVLAAGAVRRGAGEMRVAVQSAVVFLVVLAVAVAAGLAVRRVLFAAVFYPCGLVLARYGGVVGSAFLHGRPVTFTVLYLPPLAAAGAIVAAAYRGRHRRLDNRPQGTSARA